MPAAAFFLGVEHFDFETLGFEDHGGNDYAGAQLLFRRVGRCECMGAAEQGGGSPSKALTQSS